MLIMSMHTVLWSCQKTAKICLEYSCRYNTIGSYYQIPKFTQVPHFSYIEGSFLAMNFPWQVSMKLSWNCYEILGCYLWWKMASWDFYGNLHIEISCYNDHSYLITEQWKTHILYKQPPISLCDIPTTRVVSVMTVPPGRAIPLLPVPPCTPAAAGTTPRAAPIVLRLRPTTGGGVEEGVDRVCGSAEDRTGRTVVIVASRTVLIVMSAKSWNPEKWIAWLL